MKQGKNIMLNHKYHDYQRFRQFFSLIFIFFILCVQCALITPDPVRAVESYPTIVPEGEKIDNMFERIKHISKNSAVKSIAFSPDGMTIASGSDDNIVHMWDVSSGKEIRRFEGHTSRVSSVAFSPDGKTLASGSDDNTVRMWDVSLGKEIRRFEGHTSRVSSVAFSPDGKTLASGSDDNTVRMWVVLSGKEIRLFQGHTNLVSSVAFSPDGKTLASGSDDNTVRMWDVSSRKEILLFQGHTKLVSSVVFSPDGKTLASGSDDNTVRMWDVSSGKEIQLFKGHTNTVNSVAFSPDGKTLASGSDDNTVRMWDVSSEKEILLFQGHTNLVSSVAFSPDGKSIASGSDDNTVRLWDVSSRKEIRRFEGQTSCVKFVAFSRNGKSIASGSDDKTVRLWDVSSGKEIRRFEGQTSSIKSIGFSLDGQTIASWSNDATMMWDVSSGKKTLRFEGQLSGFSSATFSQDGQSIAYWSDDNTVRLANGSSGEEIQQFEGHTNRVKSVVISLDGQTIVSGSDDNTARLWDVSSGKEIRRFEGHTNLVSSVAFSQNGQPIASGYDDNTVLLWDVSSGKEIQRFGGHTNSVSSVAFSPDGQSIASGSSDNTVRLWDVSSGKVQWLYVTGQKGNWLAYDVVHQKIFRYDDGSFLVNVENGNIKPVLPPRPLQASHLVTDKMPSLYTNDGEAMAFNITLRNQGKGNAYQIRISQDFEKDNPITFFPPDPIGVFKLGEERSLECKVSNFTNRINPDGADQTLSLTITSAYEDPINLKIPVITHVPSIKLVSAAFQKQEKPTLVVSLQNIGDQNLENEVEIQAVIDKTELDPVIRKTGIDMGKHINISFALPENMKISKQTLPIITVRKLTHPIHEWTFNDHPTIPRPIWQEYLFYAIFLSGCCIMFYIISLFLHPLTTQISKKPDKILTTPIDQLSKAVSLLTRTRRLETVLSQTSIQHSWIKSAVPFFTQTNHETRAITISKRFDTPITDIPKTPIPLYKLPMGQAFILNMPECFLAFPPEDISADQVMRELKKNESVRFKICIIITTHKEQQAKLRKESKDISNMFVTPDSSELTTLLLSPEPEESFIRIIAAQIKFSRISPYKTSGGITKDSLFFGREQLLSHIMQREPANYLLIGGRQLGKSSLLHAIKRKYENDPNVRCHYLSLMGMGEDVIPMLADTLDLKADSDLQAVLAHLKKESRTKRHLFLLDEADVFVKNQAETGYKTLNAFRSLSEEGLCYFILAGFWELYNSVAFDYHSPIKNFGEFMFIAELEPKACRDLAVKPMSLLNVKYESDKPIQTLIHETGGRANLIAIACDEVLRKMESREEFIVTIEDFNRALDSNAIRSALGGWGSLTSDETDNRLDRIIVYSTINSEKFTQRELMETLKNHGCQNEPEAVKKSLVRLELAFILKREKEQFTYCVPLFKKHLLEQDPAFLLDQELAKGSQV